VTFELQIPKDYIVAGTVKFVPDLSDDDEYSRNQPVSTLTIRHCDPCGVVPHFVTVFSSPKSYWIKALRKLFLDRLAIVLEEEVSGIECDQKCLPTGNLPNPAEAVGYRRRVGEPLSNLLFGFANPLGGLTLRQTLECQADAGGLIDGGSSKGVFRIGSGPSKALAMGANPLVEAESRSRRAR
jgi:hypothetical protein